ncbi:MAG: HD domain-containing protein [Candidatus Goldiibacteriota bacterium]
MADIEKAKLEYQELLSKISGRKGVKEMAAYLEKHGLFKAPASTKYHLCIEGGLLIHQVGVAKLALKLRETLMPDKNEESIILCALFHDAHKVTDGFGNQSRPCSSR